MKIRLQQLIEKQNITPARFAEIVGVQRSSVSHILSGRNNPSLEFIQKILIAFPTISSDWLISAQGNMYRDTASRNNEVAKEDKKNRAEKATDLFSVLKDEDVPPYGTIQPVTPIKIDKDPIQKGDPAKIENSNTEELAIPKTSINTTVERIVIFYTNNTFKEYKPE